MIEVLEWLSSTVEPMLLNVPDSAGFTAADYAVRSRSKSTARLLRLRGARVSDKWAADRLPVSPGATASGSHFGGANVMYKPARSGSRYVRRRRQLPHEKSPSAWPGTDAPVEIWKQEVASWRKQKVVQGTSVQAVQDGKNKRSCRVHQCRRL